MTASTSCHHCHRTFTSAPADDPSQNASASRPRRAPAIDRPDCPHCGRRAEAVNVESAAPRAAGEAGGPGTVLIVEDDRELSEGLRAVLERQGYRVVLACNGVQGRDSIYRDRPDLVVLDMMMPRMGGFPVLEHFRGKAGAPPIIMITANEGSRHKAYAEMLGVVGYIRKPFAMETLLEAVANGLAARGGSAAPGARPPGRQGTQPSA